MIQTINLYQFREAFATMGRKDQFSYAGLESLFAYLEELSDDSGMETELDVIGLCCEFAEASYKDIASDYGLVLDGLDDDEARDVVLDFLGAHTCIVSSANELIVYCSAF